LNRLGNASWLVDVNGIRFAGINLTEVTPPSALLTTNKESCFTVFPAFIDIGATGFLADSV
jgi:hypothetical protein